MPTDLTPLIAARSVAVVGASADPARIGGRPIAYLRRSGYAGRIVPVNPRRSEIQGLRTVPDLRETEPVDLAIIATPADLVAKSVADSLEAGARSLVLFTAGYAETGEEGALAQREIAAAAQAKGAVLLGPNCLGAANFHTGMAATFATSLESRWPATGGFSYFGQSGALGTYWIEMARRAGLGLSKWISLGNEAQVTGADALRYLAEDDETRTIAAYIEDIKNPDAFGDAVTLARDAGKGVIVLKSGRSPAGARAATAHTASHPGDDAWCDRFLAEVGAYRAGSLSEMIDVAQILASDTKRTGGKRLGIATVSGGAGVLACDAAERLGVPLAHFSDDTRHRLAQVLPGYASSRNPVDLTGALIADVDLLSKTLCIMEESGECDTIMFVIGAMEGIADQLIETIAGAKARGISLVVVWMAMPDRLADRICRLNIPLFAEIEQAIVAIAGGIRIG